MSDPSSPTVPDVPSAGSSTLVGTTISGRYQVEKQLGEGGMGAVYLVQHTAMRKRFALKVLNSKTAQLPEMVARFEREAMAAAHVEHPNITVAVDFGKTDDGALYLVLEYLEGQRLRDAIAGPLELRRALHIARQIASALERSHELGVIHRDRSQISISHLRCTARTSQRRRDTDAAPHRSHASPYSYIL